MRTNSDRIADYLKFIGDYFADFIAVSQLDEMGFFDAPASTTHHGAYEGGLFDHSLAVAKALIKLTEDLGLVWERKESPKIIGLFHDLCKCDAYVEKTDDFGKSFEPKKFEYNKFLTIDGHGEKSCILTLQYVPLTDEEIYCIRWHMGAYEKDPDKLNCYGRSIKKYPNVLFTHTADMIASHIEEV